MTAAAHHHPHDVAPIPVRTSRSAFTILESLVMLAILAVFTVVTLAVVRKEWPQLWPSSAASPSAPHAEPGATLPGGTSPAPASLTNGGAQPAAAR